MKKRKFRKFAGLFLMLLAVFVQGMVFERVQGEEPASVVTIGEVSAILAEPENLEKESERAVIIENARAGQVIRRTPTVYLLEESKRAYVRAMISVSGLSGGQAQKVLGNLEWPQGWNYNLKDGYYYYKDSISAGQQVAVFESIHIPEDWKNPGRFQIDVRVEVVQASSLTPKIDAECRILEWILAE